jgi:hypothetical protein
MKTETQQRTESLKSMIRSCFTYGGAEEGTHNFERYILPFRKHFDEKTFYKIYRSHLKYLEANFVIEHNVYRDAEGLSYNSLVSKSN